MEADASEVVEGASSIRANDPPRVDFAHFLNFPGCQLLANPALVRWHPQAGRASTSVPRRRKVQPVARHTRPGCCIWDRGPSPPSSRSASRSASSTFLRSEGKALRSTASAPHSLMSEADGLRTDASLDSLGDPSPQRSRLSSAKSSKSSKSKASQESSSTGLRSNQDSRAAQAKARSSTLANGRRGSTQITLKDWFDAADLRTAGNANPKVLHPPMGGFSTAPAFYGGRAATWRVDQSEADWDEGDRLEEMRNAFREELAQAIGGPMEAFRSMDLSGSGRISMQEFKDGVDRSGVRWQQLTGLRWILDLFALFDQNRDGLIELGDLFPDELLERTPRRASTPEFWEMYCDENEPIRSDQNRHAAWHSAGPSEKLRKVYRDQQRCEDAALKRKWMRSMFRRLKGRGKSDAQCRECIASHLPRGTGPKDRQSVPTFSGTEVKECHRKYVDDMHTHLKQIQKDMYSLKEQRIVLQDTRSKLWSVTGHLVTAKQASEAQQAGATKILELGGGFFSRPKQEEDVSNLDLLDA